ncbi:MAG: ATP-binding cassette domain-containing protein [Rhodospirillales bacterium]
MTPDRPVKLSIRGLYKSFGNKAVLSGVDIDVMEGESLVVIGGSGSGKSVLIKCVLGLIRPDQGSILIDDEETVGLRGERRDIINRKCGMLFQGAALFDSLPVWENVAFGLLAQERVERASAEAVAIGKLAQVGLEPSVARHYPSELSGGMQKRVALARAIASDPDLVFFDEPTTGLDPIMADVINNLIVKTTRQVGATALSITHDMASARKIAHRIAMLYQGRIIWHGAVGEIDQTDDARVEQFIHGRAEGPIQMAIEV